MNTSPAPETEHAVHAGARQGFIAFCETNLRYERGYKAWVILGPYLLGAFAWEEILNVSHGTFAVRFALWSGFLVYVILFPELWRRILKARHFHKPARKS